MWIDASHCTKPCSVVISRISSKYKALVSKQGSESTKPVSVPVLKSKKHQRTSFDRALLIQSGKTGQERKSSRLHGPKSRLRSRTAFNYSTNMPAPLNKEFASPHTEDRARAMHFSTFSKSSEWQKSTSSNPFKLRLKCLNKEKSLLAKRKWTLQSNKSDPSAKCAKEEPVVQLPSQEAEPEKVKTTEDPIKKPVPVSTVTRNVNATPKPASSKAVVSADKSPLSKLVISCNKAYRCNQSMLNKVANTKRKEDPKSEGVKTHRKMTAYTVYTKLRENSIESINCKRYKKRKEVKPTKMRNVRSRDASAFSFVSKLSSFKNDGSVEAEVRATLDALVSDVVSAELDELLNLEAPSPEMRNLLRTFCKQYGYNYDKDFSDLQNSVLNFSVTDSTSHIMKKPKAKVPTPEPEPKRKEEETNSPPPQKNLKRRRKRKWDSSEDSDDQECPEILSAMMRSRSKERRNRLSKLATQASSSSQELPKRRLRPCNFAPLFTYTDDSDHESIFTQKSGSNSESERTPKPYSEDDEETDCGETAISGHIYIPPLSSEDTSDEEEDQKNLIKADSPIHDKPEATGNQKTTTDVNQSKEEISAQVDKQSLKAHEEQKTENDQSSVSDLLSATAKPVDLEFGVDLPIASVYGGYDVKTELCDRDKKSNLDDLLSSGDESNVALDKQDGGDTGSLLKKPVTLGSPDLGWESDNLVICLDPQPSEESSFGETAPEPEDPSRTTQTPTVREISYETPRFNLLDVQKLIKAERQDAKEILVNNSGVPLICKVEQAETTDLGQNGSRTPALKSDTNAKETTDGSHTGSKLHRTPVQKVLPRVKSRSPSLQNNYAPQQTNPRSKDPAPGQTSPRKLTPVEDPKKTTQKKDLCFSKDPLHYPQPQITSDNKNSPLTISGSSPLLIQTTSPICVPTSIPSPVPIHALLNSKVSPLTVLPVATPSPPHRNVTVPPLSISMTSSLPVQTSLQNTPLVSLFPVNDPMPVVSVTNPESNKPAPPNSLPPVAPPTIVTESDIARLDSQTALDISILRTLLLDPPPDGGPGTEIHNLIIQKAKELEEAEQNEDTGFNLPVITNVVSLNEEVMKQESALKKESPQEAGKQASPGAKVPPPKNLEPGSNRYTDSPEIVEEKLKSSTPTAKNTGSPKPNLNKISLGENLTDVLRNLQLEIKNLDKMAEEKKKEYFLIMYIRNFKRDTLRRLHESIRNKTCISPSTKRLSQNAANSDSNQTHLKETCLVRPMVQSQHEPASTPSPKAQKVPESKTTAEPQKPATVANLLSNNKPRFSPEVRHPSADSIPPVHSSLAALNKLESEIRTGFRTYLSPTNAPTPPQNYNNKDCLNQRADEICNMASGFTKYESHRPSAKNVQPAFPIATQNPHQPPSATSTSSPSLTSSVTTPSPPSFPSQMNSQTVNNIDITAWKGTVSAYLQKNKTVKPSYPSGGSVVPSPYPNTVKNLLKQTSVPTSNAGIGSVPNPVKDFQKNVDTTRPQPQPQGPPHLPGPPFLDIYPFQALASANNYLQSAPFWPANVPPNKQNTSLASLQAARDLYMNSLTFGAWRTAKCAEMESERLGEKKLWNPASTSMPRPYLQENPDPTHNMSTHRPFHYGTLRKCVVCKMADAQFICSGCGKDWYCSVTCQRQNWRVHSRSCVSPSN